jgi:SNF2 family DNA or RNA helicase
MDILKDQIESRSLRRTKDLLDLPPKTIINEIIDMNNDHRKFYDDLKAGIKSESLKIELNSANVLSLVTRLRQATACPSILTSENISATKLERAKEIIDDLISQNEKVCVFSTFKDSVYTLAEMLSEYNPIVATGDQSDTDIIKARDSFQEDPNKKILLATWQKMGTGITLTAASYMICIDTAWTAAVQEQTEDRIYRIGTDKPVFIYRLICSNTIDERVAQLLEDKQALSDYLIDDKITDKSIENLRKYIEDL